MSWNTIDPTTRQLAQQTLTPKQLHILQDRTNGHSWRTIATAHHITEATARGHHKAALTNLERARKDNAA
jgi:DNA-binding NarL/FixJ family response regulator